MHWNKHIICPAILLLYLVGGAASADTINFVGTLRTLLPTVTITTSSDPIADAKEFTLSVSADAGVCRVTGDQTDAMDHNGTISCLIEWDDPQGLAEYLSGLRGVVSGPGQHTFTYTLKIFDLNSFDDVVTDSYSVNFAAPVQADIPTLTSEWAIGDNTFTYDADIYNRAQEHLNVKAETTQRKYKQVIKFGEMSCVIPIGSTQCSISIKKKFDQAPLNDSEVVSVSVTDPYDFQTQPRADYTYNMDFRPPEITGVHVNALANKLPEVITDYGSNFVLYHNQAAVVVESPHQVIGPEFLPTDPKLVIKQNEDLFITNKVNYGGTDVFFDLGDIQGDSEVVLEPINDPYQIGSYLLYVYDFSFVQDGLYDFEFSTLDGNGNGETQSINDIYVDRYPPDIQFVVNGKQQKSRSIANVFALSDITVLSWGGWDDGSEMVSATLNGEPIDFDFGTANVKRLSNLPIDLGTVNSLTVTARDTVGNEFSRTLDFNFGKYTFSQTVEDAMVDVQPVQLKLKQSSGPYCVFFSSYDLAAEFSAENINSNNRGCTVEWITYPNGIDVNQPTPVMRNINLVIDGISDSIGTHSYEFKIHSHDAYGDDLVIYQASGSFDVVDLATPEVTLGYPHILANYGPDYVNPLPIDRNLIIPVEIKAEPGASIMLEAYDHQGVMFDSKSFDDVREVTRYYIKQQHGLAAMSDYSYLVKVYYTNREGSFTEKEYKFYTVPPSSVRLTLEHSSAAIDDSSLPVTAKLGEKSGSSVHYTTDMGEWSVGFYHYNREIKNYELVSQLHDTSITGDVVVNLDSDLLAQYSGKLIAIAKLKTPHPTIEIQRLANSVSLVPVVSLDSIDASLSSDQVSAPVEASFHLNIDFAEDLDRSSTGGVTWETSPDGVAWTPTVVNGINTSAFFQIREPGELYVRAQVTNSVTNAVTTTNTIHLVGYETAELSLSGNKYVAEGAISTISYLLNEFAVDNLVGDVEYSIDEKATWSPMSPDQNVVIPESLTLYARALINDGENPPYYVYSDVFIKSLTPRNLGSMLRGSIKKAEIGETVDLQGKVTVPSYFSGETLRYQITLPDGSVVDDLELSHTFIASDFVGGEARFSLRSWIEGFELSTVSTSNFSVAEITYAGLPPTSVDLTTPKRVNFSSVSLRLKYPDKDLIPNSVEVTASVELPADDSLELQYLIGTSLKLRALKEGTHAILVRFSDNRGNERDHIEFVEITEPPEIELSMKNTSTEMYIRPPYRLASSLSMSFGSPDDRVESILWELNGDEYDLSNRTINRFVLNSSGSYEIKATVTSKFGQTKSVSTYLELLPNQLPECDPFWESRDSMLLLNANCKDYDGKIYRVAFTYKPDADSYRTINRYFSPSLAFFQGLYDDSEPVSMEVLDSSEETITLSVDWPGDMQ
tara:strand:- start:15945 stop:20147 length:4203 start_codon:yes stop_codon:yes gene_type:complete